MAISASILAIAVIFGAFVRFSGGDQPRATRPRTAANPFGTEPGWTQLPDPPLPPRSSPALAWTGKEVLFYGGTRYDLDVDSSLPVEGGAAYDPVRGWRELPPKPAYGPSRGGSGIWTGRDWIFAGERCHSSEPAYEWCSSEGLAAVAYDPVADAWRSLAAPPDPTTRLDHMQALGWDGRFATFWIPSKDALSYVNEHEKRVSFAEQPDHFYRYEPSKDEWSELDLPGFDPERAKRTEVCSSDGNIVAVSYELVELSAGTKKTGRLLVAVRTPGAGWRLPDTSAIAAAFPPRFLCAGDYVLFSTARGADRLDTNTLEWEGMTRPPVTGFKQLWGRATFNGRELFRTDFSKDEVQRAALKPYGWDGDIGYAINVAKNEWRAIPAGPEWFDAQVAVGDAIFSYIDVPSDERWRPQPRTHVYVPPAPGETERPFPSTRGRPLTRHQRREREELEKRPPTPAASSTAAPSDGQP